MQTDEIQSDPKATNAIADLAVKAQRVTELYRVGYLRGNADGGRASHAMGQLSGAIEVLLTCDGRGVKEKRAALAAIIAQHLSQGQEKFDSLVAENTRLRVALTQITKRDDWTSGECRSCARAALAVTPPC